MLEAASLFDVEIDELEPPASEPLPPAFQGISESDLNPNEWFSVCVLTVPDIQRFPIPKRFTEDKSPVDLSGLDEMSWGDVRRLIQPTLPDDQLMEIQERERNREKPRAKVLEAITEEQATRGGGFRDWVTATSRNPLTCRIAALAYHGRTQAECMSFSVESTSHERAVLEELFDVWHSFETRSGFDRVAGWEIDFTMRVISARRAALGLQSERQDFRPCIPVSAGRWADCAEAAGGLAVAAVSLGIAEHEIPEIAGPMDVWRSWRKDPGLVELSDWCAGQLQLEWELLTITQGLW